MMDDAAVELLRVKEMELGGLRRNGVEVGRHECAVRAEDVLVQHCRFRGRLVFTHVERVQKMPPTVKRK